MDFFIVESDQDEQTAASWAKTMMRASEANVRAKKTWGAIKPVRATQAKTVRSLSVTCGVATYSDEHSGFYRAPVLRANSPFVTNLVTIDKGSFAGFKAILISPSATFPFLKLPAELRRAIYKLIFVFNEPLRVTTHRMKNRHNDPCNALCSNFGGTGLPLLKVNRQINQEAVHVFYRKNKFIFDSSTTVYLFFCRFSPPLESRIHIAKITVGDYFLSSYLNMFEVLAKRPQTIEVEFTGNIRYRHGPGALARRFFRNAQKFFDVVAQRRRYKVAGLDLLSFNRASFYLADGLGNPSWIYTQEQREVFFKTLRSEVERSIVVKKK